METQYGRYIIKKELGRGAMGVVYLAHDPHIDRLVALKVLHTDKVVNRELVQRFYNEARAIGRLAHPNIVVIHDVGSDQGTIYIAMEYIEGNSFTNVIKSGRPDYATWSRIGIQLAETLAHAHDQGIIHRDIKPSNIILTGNDRIKLTDFGISRIEDPKVTLQTHVGDILGTPAYMSPEQVAGQPVDGRSDLYSLGVVLYEWLLGQRPYHEKGITAIFNAIIQKPPIPPQEIDQALPKPLVDLLLKCLQKPLSERFQNGQQMAAAIKNSLNQMKRKRKRPSSSGSIRRWRQWGLVGFLLVVSVGYMTEPHIFDKVRQWITSTPSEVTLQVTSAPSGAQLFIDDDLKGTTPINLTLPVGTHQVRLSLSGYYGWEASLQLNEPIQKPLHIRLEKK